MAFAVALGLLYATDRLGIAAILVLAFLTGLTQSQSAPTYQAVITSLVPPRAHPERGGAELAAVQPVPRDGAGDRRACCWRAAGPAACFAVNARRFLAVIVALWRIEIPRARRRSRSRRLASSLGDGLRHVAGEPRAARASPCSAAAG